MKGETRILFAFVAVLVFWAIFLHFSQAQPPGFHVERSAHHDR